MRQRFKVYESDDYLLAAIIICPDVAIEKARGSLAPEMTRASLILKGQGVLRYKYDAEFKR